MGTVRLMQSLHLVINSSTPGQNDRHFPNDIFSCIFVNEKLCILFKNALKFLPYGSINNNQALAWIIALRRIGHMTLFEPMLARYTDAKCNATYQHLLDDDINISLETIPMCCPCGSVVKTL